jgi:hypothetical protein
MRWSIETFLEDSKQGLGLGDCEMQIVEGASADWHLLMAAYSLVLFDSGSIGLGTVRSKASSLRANLEHSLKETVYNLLSWVRDNDDRNVDDLTEEIDTSSFTQPPTLTCKAEYGVRVGFSRIFSHSVPSFEIPPFPYI